VSDEEVENPKKVPFWLWPNVLGLDAPLVAVAWQFFFAEVFRLKIPASNYLTLGLAVWVIYSVDRLLDARQLRAPERAAARHRFYRRWYVPMAAITALVAAEAVFLALTRLPANLVHVGLMLSALVGVYFVHRIWIRGPMLLVLPKEVFAGFVFAVGATLAGHVWSSEIPEALWSAEVLCFGALCSLNCLAISVWERESDADNDPNALAQMWPEVVGGFPLFAWAAAAAACGFAAWQHTAAGFPVFVAVAAGAVAIALLATLAGRMRVELSRVLADVAVLLPVAAVLPALPWLSTI